MNKIKDKLFVTIQRFLPQHLLSELAFKISQSENRIIKDFLIKIFIKRYSVDLSIAKLKSEHSYKSFHHFFTREIELEKRLVSEDITDLCSPAEGKISQIGMLNDGMILQAKEHKYKCATLLGGDINFASKFKNGNFATIYLAPKDYHRIHMPIDGTLKKMTFVPGKLFSVNEVTANNIPNLFALNERVVLIFDTMIGEIAIVLVGAMIVGSIYTQWAGTIKCSQTIKSWHYSKDQKISYEKGEEIAYFHMGSTMILLTQENTMHWQDTLAPSTEVLVRQTIGKIKS